MTAVAQEAFIRFVVELLAEHRRTDGWVRVGALAEAVGVSRATAWRYLQSIEASGVLTVEHDIQRPAGREHRGIRATHQLTRRPPAREGTHA